MNGGRFSTEVSWKDFAGNTGSGQAVPLTSDTGYFWFFSSNNVELVVKVLDARAFNGRFWVFYGALSNVEYTLTVTDTTSGHVKSYTNPSGTFGSVGDTDAFPASVGAPDLRRRDLRRRERAPRDSPLPAPDRPRQRRPARPIRRASIFPAAGSASRSPGRTSRATPARGRPFP